MSGDSAKNEGTLPLPQLGLQRGHPQPDIQTSGCSKRPSLPLWSWHALRGTQHASWTQGPRGAARGRRPRLVEPGKGRSREQFLSPMLLQDQCPRAQGGAWAGREVDLGGWRRSCLQAGSLLWGVGLS